MGIRGEPELFLRRSLLFSADSMGCCDDCRDAFTGRIEDGVAGVGRWTELELLSIDITDGFGLKVTFRPFRCVSGELGAAAEGRRGVLSVVLVEAIADQLEEQESSQIRDLRVPET